MEEPSVPVSSSVTLGLVTTGPGGSSARWASITTRQGALEGGGDNLRGQVEVIPQVLDTLVGQTPVKMSPGELFLYVATGLQGGQSFDDLNKKQNFSLSSKVILCTNKV